MAAPLKHYRHWADWSGWSYVLIILTVLLRLWHIWVSQSNPTFWAPAVDPAWYDEAAQNILRGDWGEFPLFRAPLYPVLLAGVYGIFGHDLVAARLLNILLQSLTVWGILKVGRSYFSPTAGVIAAALFALNGMTIYFAGEILSTSAEMLAATLAAWATFRLTRDAHIGAILLCGLTWGAAAITRPNFLLVFPVVIAAVWIQNSKSRPRLLAAGVWLAAAFLPILPVTVANLVKGHEFVLLATQGGVNFWIGNNPESTGILSVLPGYGNTWTMEDAESEATRELGHSPGPGELSDFYFAKGMKFLTDHPWAGFRLMLRKTLLFFNRFEISNNKHISYFAAKTAGLPYLIFVGFGVLLPLAAIGICAHWRDSKVQILVGFIGLYAISVILYFITSRFRMPAVPWLSWLAAVGLVQFRSMLSKPLSWIEARIFACGVVTGVITWMNIWELQEAPIGWARYMEGNAYLKLNQLDSAHVCFEDAVRDSQAVDRSYLNLGVIAQRRNRMDEAKRFYRQALDFNPANAEAWNNLGTVQESLGDTVAAIESYRRARDLKSWSDDWRYNLAGVFFKIGVRHLRDGNGVLAVAYLDSCMQLQETAIVNYDLALALLQVGEEDSAYARLERALALDPGLEAARRLKTRMELQSAGLTVE